MPRVSPSGLAQPLAWYTVPPTLAAQRLLHVQLVFGEGNAGGAGGEAAAGGGATQAEVV